MPPKAKRTPKGKRYPLNMRTTRELRERIEAAAEASGRSLVQEVEYRLEQSFERQAILEEIRDIIRREIQVEALIERTREHAAFMEWRARIKDKEGKS